MTQPEIISRDSLDRAEVSDVQALVDAVTDVDEVAPVSEHILLHLRHGGDRGGLSILARQDDDLVGYAHLDVTDQVEGPSAELTVRPESRRHGVATALMTALEQASERAGHDGRLRLWAHGRQPAAAELARSHGYVEERVLLQLRRSLLSGIPALTLPDGVSLRAFAVDQDEDAWLAVNNAAFADHPDQGGWSAAELRFREQEPWFDPNGFLLAVRDQDDSLLGFHWTKVHGHDPHGHEPIGEVYVVGVDPSAQGMGLGRALTLAGLRHLRGRGLSQVMLYVDESNTAAVRTYTSLGFTRWAVDVQYRRGV